MAYRNKVIEHLEDYKQHKFPKHLNGYWMRSKPPKVLKYAFRKKDATNNEEDENIISFYQKQFIKSRFSAIKRHMYFHHMNSSQAMCVNFFYPLYKEDCLEMVTEYLGFKDEKVDYNSAAFEKESKIDRFGNRRPTNFDFYFETESNKKFYFEIKYTEQKFGKAIIDDVHIDKYNKIYKNHLEKIKPQFQNMTSFLNNYQIMRNIIHIDENEFVVFVYPKFNKKIKEQAIQAKSQILNKPFDTHLFTIEWEDIFKVLKDKVKFSNLKKQMDEFGKKYIIDSSLK